MKNKKLFIVAGAAGEIGIEYCKTIISHGFDCIGVVRNKEIEIVSENFTQIKCDLSDEKQIESVFSDIDFQKYTEVVYLHTIGNDKFDPRGYPNIKPMETIDAGVYNTNVNSFKYLLKYCANKIRDINEKKLDKIVKFRIVIIAGVADKHAPFVIESFCEVKFILRQYIQSYVNLYSSWISGLSINISSTITKSALAVRPKADTTYWLTPKEVVYQSFEKLVLGSVSYEEIDIIKHHPEFTKDYYENNKILYEKWSRETGIY